MARLKRSVFKDYIKELKKRKAEVEFIEPYTPEETIAHYLGQAEALEDVIRELEVLTDRDIK